MQSREPPGYTPYLYILFSEKAVLLDSCNCPETEAGHSY